MKTWLYAIIWKWLAVNFWFSNFYVQFIFFECPSKSHFSRVSISKTRPVIHSVNHSLCHKRWNLAKIWKIFQIYFMQISFKSHTSGLMVGNPNQRRNIFWEPFLPRQCTLQLRALAWQPSIGCELDPIWWAVPTGAKFSLLPNYSRNLWNSKTQLWWAHVLQTLVLCQRGIRLLYRHKHCTQYGANVMSTKNNNIWLPKYPQQEN